MLAASIVKVVEEELTLRSIPEDCNIQSFLVLVITYNQSWNECFGIIRIWKKWELNELEQHVIWAPKEFWSEQKLKCFWKWHVTAEHNHCFKLPKMSGVLKGPNEQVQLHLMKET